MDVVPDTGPLVIHLVSDVAHFCALTGVSIGAFVFSADALSSRRTTGARHLRCKEKFEIIATACLLASKFLPSTDTVMEDAWYNFHEFWLIN